MTTPTLDVENDFTYHPPTGTQPARYAAINSAAKLFAWTVLEHCPPGADRSAAYRSIREAKMWANAAIATGEAPTPPAATDEPEATPPETEEHDDPPANEPPDEPDEPPVEEPEEPRVEEPRGEDSSDSPNGPDTSQQAPPPAVTGVLRVLGPASDDLPVMPLVRSLALDGGLVRRAIGWDDIDITRGSAAVYEPDPAGSGETVLRAPFNRTLKSGSSPIENIQTLHLLGLREALWIVRLRVGRDFWGNGTRENKQIWLGLGGASNNIFLTLRGSGNTVAFRPAIKVQGVLDPRKELRPEGFVQGGQVLRDIWYTLAIYANMNRAAVSTGTSNGELALIMNDQVVDYLGDVNFTWEKAPTQPPLINSAMLDPTYGGGGASPAQDGSIWYSALALYGR